MSKELLRLENKWSLGDEHFDSTGAIDHKSLIIDRLFNPSKAQVGDAKKPEFKKVEVSQRKCQSSSSRQCSRIYLQNEERH